jgi:hypothetical protein
MTLIFSKNNDFTRHDVGLTRCQLFLDLLPFPQHLRFIPVRVSRLGLMPSSVSLLSGGHNTMASNDIAFLYDSWKF